MGINDHQLCIPLGLIIFKYPLKTFWNYPGVLYGYGGVRGYCYGKGHQISNKKITANWFFPISR